YSQIQILQGVYRDSVQLAVTDRVRICLAEIKQIDSLQRTEQDLINDEKKN
ncbi:unnamed protein product, partial [Rotaria sp. Silwood1]